MPAPDPAQKTPWDLMLTKYVHVWLWSILVGATTGTGYSFLSYRSSGWGPFGLSLIIIQGFGAASVIASLYLLSRFLLGYLLPVFFTDAVASDAERFKAGLRLSQSFKFLIMAVLVRFLMTAAELVLSSVK